MSETLGHNGDLILGLITGAIMFIVWLIRLEAKTNINEKSLDRNERELRALEAKHDALVDRIFDKLSVIERALARIEGKFNLDKDKV